MSIYEPEGPRFYDIDAVNVSLEVNLKCRNLSVECQGCHCLAEVILDFPKLSHGLVGIPFEAFRFTTLCVPS